MITKITRPILISLLLGTALSACVTTEDRVFTADTSPERAVEARVNLAMKYYRDNDMDAARRHLDTAMKIDSRAPSVHNALALIFSREGDERLAEKHFKKAISLDSKYSPARNNYAAFLYQLERYPQALKQLKHVANDELYDGRILALGNMGRVQQKLNDSDGARKTFRRILNIDSRNLLALQELAHLEYDQKNYNLSAALYDKYRAISPQQSARALLLGIRLSETITNNNARASYVMALKNLYPTSPEYKRFVAGDYE